MLNRSTRALIEQTTLISKSGAQVARLLARALLELDDSVKSLEKIIGRLKEGSGREA